VTLENIREREEGFTLIELLVVVIIIGILAAIAIPTFLNQREKGWEAAAKSALKGAAVAQESYFTEENEYASAEADLELEGFNQSDDVELTIISPTGAGATDYCMSAEHDAGGDIQYLDSADGEITETACT
jgi:type IV pilus assembly protein PilA